MLIKTRLPPVKRLMEAKCTVKYSFNTMTDEFLHGVAKTLLDFFAGLQSRFINLTPFFPKLFFSPFCSAVLNNYFRY